MALNTILKFADYTDIYTKTNTIMNNELVGTGRNWIAPAIVLGIGVVDFASLLITYKAELKFYYDKDDNSKIKWFSYHWDNLSDARVFKNYVNKIAREKKITVGSIIKSSK